MKRIFIIIPIIILAASLAFAASKDIISSEAKNLMAKNKQMFLLDVRTPEEYRQGHLRGAVLIPMGEMERRIAEVPGNRPVLVYCAVGSRSRAVAGFLAERGYRSVYNMSDGIVGWYRNGMPVER